MQAKSSLAAGRTPLSPPPSPCAYGVLKHANDIVNDLVTRIDAANRGRAGADGTPQLPKPSARTELIPRAVQLDETDWGRDVRDGKWDPTAIGKKDSI